MTKLIAFQHGIDDPRDLDEIRRRLREVSAGRSDFEIESIPWTWRGGEIVERFIACLMTRSKTRWIDLFADHQVLVETVLKEIRGRADAEARRYDEAEIPNIARSIREDIDVGFKAAWKHAFSSGEVLVVDHRDGRPSVVDPRCWSDEPPFTPTLTGWSRTQFEQTLNDLESVERHYLFDSRHGPSIGEMTESEKAVLKAEIERKGLLPPALIELQRKMRRVQASVAADPMLQALQGASETSASGAALPAVAPDLIERLHADDPSVRFLVLDDLHARSVLGSGGARGEGPRDAGRRAAINQTRDWFRGRIEKGESWDGRRACALKALERELAERSGRPDGWGRAAKDIWSELAPEAWKAPGKRTGRDS